VGPPVAVSIRSFNDILPPAHVGRVYVATE